MAFKKYKYGTQKKEITTLLRKRLMIREKIRYYDRQLENYKLEELNLEITIHKRLKFIKDNM